MEQITKERHEQISRSEFVHAPKALDHLFTLQAEQREHDRNFHADIHILPVHQKVNHMVLHFAKYSGLMAEHEDEKEFYNKVLIDVFIISLSLANILNLNLTKAFEASENNFSESLTSLRSIAFVRKKTAIYAGRMAKACESIDHLENYPFRTELQNNLVEMCGLVMNAADYAKIDLREAVHQRLLGVRKKNIFYNQEKDT